MSHRKGQWDTHDVGRRGAGSGCAGPGPGEGDPVASGWGVEEREMAQCVDADGWVQAARGLRFK
jgi:hypothetical protein